MRKREHRKWGCVERNTRSIILSLVPRHCFLLNVFFLLVAYHLSLVAVSAQGGGPPGGHVQALAIDPSSPATLYAGTSGGGIFKSTNGGTSWISINSGLTSTDVEVLAIDPSNPATLYAGTDGSGLFKSANGGTTWARVIIRIDNSGLPFSPKRVNAVVIDPSNPDTLYAGSNDCAFNCIFSGIFKTINGGITWTGINSGLTNKHVHTIAIDPTTPSTLYAGTDGGGVFKSANGGTAWTAVNSGWTASSIGTYQFVNVLAIDPSTSATVYAGTGSEGVFKSTSKGSWTAVNFGLTSTIIQALAIDPSTPATLYVGTYRGVFKSITGGKSWTAVNSGLAKPDIHALAIDPATPATLYAGSNGGGVFKNTKEKTDWAPVNSGLNAAHAFTLTIDPSAPATVYAGILGGGVFKSINGGTGWSSSKSGLTNDGVTAMAIHRSTPTTVYAGVLGGIFKTTNGGTSWTKVTVQVGNTGLPFDSNAQVNVLAIDPSTPTTIYAGANTCIFFCAFSGVFKSINGGTSWTVINSGLTGKEPVQAIAIDPSAPTTLYAGTNGGGVFKTTNGGINWTAVNSGLTDTTVQALAIGPSTTGTLYAGTNRGIFKSTDGGSSWTAVVKNAQVQVLAIDASTPGTLYAGTAGGVLKGTNGGTNWTALSGLQGANVIALAIDPSTPGTLYAGTYGGGILKSTNTGMTWQPTGASTVTLPAAAIAKVSGDNQNGALGKPLRYPLVAVVTDSSGLPVAGATVDFRVVAGEGTLSGGRTTTDAQGVAFISLTLGPASGTHIVTATATGLTGSPLTFTAARLKEKAVENHERPAVPRGWLGAFAILY